MDTAAIGTIGELLRLEAGQEMSLELQLYIRSPAVVEVLEAVKQDGLALRFASAELKGDREVVMEAVKQSGLALRFASQELMGDREI
eukprot:1562545-Heterocapsa_arctica.AAC.1